MKKVEADADTSESPYRQAAAEFVEDDDFPVELVCPITQTLMHDPVLTVQGNVYERAAITEWLQTHTTGQQAFQPRPTTLRMHAANAFCSFARSVMVHLV